MKKDVIYVDIEDDITSIIEKVKAAGAKIVAVVPPKRIGVLQSVVNLKLLQRAAEGSDKRVVLITNDLSLAGLAAGVSIPVAKNLQSKPELAPVAIEDTDGDDVINGEELPVGELALTAPLADSLPDEPGKTPVARAAIPAAALAASQAPKKNLSIPNFDSFRKKLFIFGGLGLALLAFLIWALFFAPKATVEITAKTTAYDVNKALRLNPSATLDADEGRLRAIVKEIQKTASVDFTATGKKDVGEKATGTVTLVNNDESDPVTVPAGSGFTTSSGRQFISDSSVTVPGFRRVSGQDRPGTATVAVTAVNIGEEYNVGAQSLVSNDVTIDAQFDQATSGGSKRQVTVVSAEDVEKAKEKLTAQDSEAVKKELREQFEDSTVAITESFVANAGAPTVSPAIGQEAQGAKLTAETKYSMIAAEKDDVRKIIEANIREQLEGLPNQKIYDNGLNSIRFKDFAPKENGGYAVTLLSTGEVGPNINTSNLTKQIVGKRAGEIREQVQSIDGVESVDVKLSPFWVTKAPGEKKITIKFLVKNEAN